MTGSFRNIIASKFDKDISLDYSEWSAVVTNSDSVLVSHLRSTVDYYVEYFDGEDLSFILYENNRAVGVFPLFIYKSQTDWKISGDGVSLIKPLFIDSIAKKTKKRLEKTIVKIIEEIANNLEIKKIQLFDDSIRLSSWYLLWLERANKSFLTHQLAINLQRSIEEIKLGFRKSYKPLVNKALKEWDIFICNDNLNENFEAFRLLHLRVAERETRSRKSWKIQQQQIENNEAFLVMVKNNNVLVGAGFFTYTKDIGSYSAGAYKRELFDKPIGHGVQMKAIEMLKEKGCKKYLIGQKMTSLDKNIPTDKELSISHFKEGFAEYVYTQPHLEVTL
jgi:FemAB family protein